MNTVAWIIAVVLYTTSAVNGNGYSKSVANDYSKLVASGYLDYAVIDQYPEGACHSSANGTQIICYIKNGRNVEECAKLCAKDPSRCKWMRFTKLNECVFYIDNSTRGCTDHGVSNIMEWTYNNWDITEDVADLTTVTYAKKYDFTGLRVRWMGNMRSGTDCNACGIYYWFTFNGEHCSNPDKIDHSWYNGGHGRSELRHAEFEGICNGLNAGNVSITFHIGNLPSGHYLGDANTGWSTSNRIIAEEVDLRESNSNLLKPCLSQSVFNVKQKVAYFDADQNSGELTDLTFVYNKLSSSSGLRLKGYLNMRGMGNAHCIRYYFTMNGQECSDPCPLDTSLNWFDPNDVSQQLGSRSFEGICDGLPAGVYTIRLMLDSCPWSNNGMDARSGWNSVSRVIAEEVRYNAAARTVLYNDGTIRETPTFNVQHWNWYDFHDIKTDGVIVTVHYVKTSNNSGLRMLFNSVNRITKTPNHCAHWFFTFNGHKCSNPGEIGGIHKEHSFELAEFNKLRPKTISGICRGTSKGDLMAGKYDIDLRVGQCPSGHYISYVITGYKTRMTIMAEEVMYTEGPGHN